ncbi:MAG: cation:proton antiporter [Planctomycetaceae bacterium]|nr:cation:proton antiporter [Planctomycetaceae bacterium]
MDTWGLLLEIVILLAGCLVMGGVLTSLKQNPLVGYLLAGMLLGGPGGLGVIQAEENIEAIAELGVAPLLFSLGLEFSWQRLVGLGRNTLLAGAVQVVLTAVATAAVVLLFDRSMREAVALGAMVSLSSTAAVLRVLIDRSEIDSSHGRNAVAVLLVQDMAVVPLAILMTLLSRGGTPTEVAMGVLRILGLAGGLVLALYLLLNHVAVRALGQLSVEKNRELTVLLAVVVGFGATWAAHAIGLSPALGAFMAGMFLGSSPFATQLRADVSSIRVVLLTLFFGAVGMVADPLWIAANFPMVFGIAAVLILFKASIVWGILRAMGQPNGVALATGLCLGQVGEFAFVLGSTAVAAGVIGRQLHMVIVSSAIVTLFLTPYLVSFAPRVGAALSRWRGNVQERKAAAAGEHRNLDVLIIGFGPAGQAIAQALTGRGLQILVLDLNRAAARVAEPLGLHVQAGDASSVEVLEHAGAASARIVVITLPARSAALAVMDSVRAINSTAHVVIRSRYQRHAAEFERAGADEVIGDEFEVGRSLADHVSRQVDVLCSDQHSDNGGSDEEETALLAATDQRPEAGSTGEL